MFVGEARENAVANLVRLVEKNNYCIGTGFPGTPYILFALADNGREDVALKMLLNDKCPSWLHEVKMGATTIWERWDGLNEDGVCPISDDGTDMMISYNHYASGAVGDFLYRRIAGIEPTAPGYKRFMINPLISKEIKHAKGVFDAPYGRIVSDWKVLGDKFVINVSVPVGCECELHMPDGSIMSIGSGKYERKCVVNVG
jgi:alpha-L-rhamnosidase